MRCSWDWLVRDGDTPLEARTKTTVVPFCTSVGTILAIVTVLNMNSTGATYVLNIAAFLALTLSCLGFVVGVLLDVAPVGTLLDATLIIWTLAICAKDLVDATDSYAFRSWTFVVLVLDMALVYKRDRVPYVIISCVLLYLAAINAEHTERFGLTEVGYWGSKGAEGSFCNCASPPCSHGVGHAVFIMACFAAVFLGDFYFTRSFANNMRLQLRRVEASVEVAAEIAAALGRYDVDGAELAIEKGTDLPEELVYSFVQLLSRLRSYKAYLPHSCLISGEGRGSANEDTESGSSQTREWSNTSERDKAAVEGPLYTPEPPDSISLPSTENGGKLDGNGRLSPGRQRGSTHRTAGLMVKPRKAKVSLVARNVKDYLSSGDLREEANQIWIATDVARWCLAVNSVKGVVDVIAGDRRYASFNARQRLCSHAVAAVALLCSEEWPGPGQRSCWSGCVVTGPVVCGCFGSSTTLRFMILGGISSSLHPFERIAALWQEKALVDGEVFASACHYWEGQLLGAAFIPKRGRTALRLYRMICRKEVDADEWTHLLPGGGIYEELNGKKEAAVQARIQKMSQEPFRMPPSAAVPRLAQSDERSSSDGVLDVGTSPSDSEASRGQVLWHVTEVGLY